MLSMVSKEPRRSNFNLFCTLGMHSKPPPQYAINSLAQTLTTTRGFCCQRNIPQGMSNDGGNSITACKSCKVQLDSLPKLDA